MSLPPGTCLCYQWGPGSSTLLSQQQTVVERRQAVSEHIVLQTHINRTVTPRQELLSSPFTKKETESQRSVAAKVMRLVGGGARICSLTV